MNVKVLNGVLGSLLEIAQREAENEQAEVIKQIQEIVTNLSEQKQYTLGSFIKKLESLTHQNREIISDCGIPSECFDYEDYFYSWRGDYTQISLGYPCLKGLSVKDLLKQAKKAVGMSFEGYKGGGFIMKESTPLWITNDIVSWEDNFPYAIIEENGKYKILTWKNS